MSIRSSSTKRRKKRLNPLGLALTVLATFFTAVLTVIPSADRPVWVGYACGIGVLVVQKLIAAIGDYKK